MKEMYNNAQKPIQEDRIHFVKTDATELLFRDDYFELCVAINSFEHIPNPAEALSEMVRCTKPGGFIYIEFDPIWTADTGSHFFDRVPEPWAHLLLPQSEFADRMTSAGAADWEVYDFTHGMNQKSLQYFNSILCPCNLFEVLHRTTEAEWSGVVDESHLQHPNFEACLSLGYTSAELMLRGMRTILKVV